MLSITDLTDQVLERTGYLAELQKDKTLQGQTRRENLEEFQVGDPPNTTANTKTMREWTTYKS